MENTIRTKLNPIKVFPTNPLGYKMEWVSIDNYNFALRNNKALECPLCHKGIIKKKVDKWVAACPNCTSVYNFFQPTPFQDAFLRNLFSPRTRNVLAGNVGAFRSGKTVLDMYAVMQSVLMVPGIRVMILANTVAMLKRVAKTELESFIMDEWMEINKDGKIRKSFTEGYYFKNGSSILFFPSDDKQKIRSTTAGAIVVIEADKLPYNFITELEGRLSQYDIGTIGKVDQKGLPIYQEEEVTFAGKTNKTLRQVVERNFMYMICEANPDTNTWVYRKWLLGAERIYSSKSAEGVEKYAISKNNNIPGLTMWLSATIDNPAMGRDYIDSKMKSWTQKEIRQNLYAEFVMGDNIIYPNIQDVIVPYQGDIKTWPHIFSIDPGVGKDPFAIVESHFNPNKKQWEVIWSEQYYKNTLSEILVPLQARMKEKVIYGVVIDKSAKKTFQTATGNFDTYAELERLLGYSLTPSISDIDGGIKLTNDMFKRNYLKICENNGELIKNLLEYEYGEFGNDEDGYKTKVKPRPGQMDHLPDALRYMVQYIAGFNAEAIVNDYKYNPAGVGLEVYNLGEEPETPYQRWLNRNNKEMDVYN